MVRSNTFEIIPAIDILDGKCVRLTQGKYDQVEEFSTNPIDVAKKWASLGARRLHVIDLDGAKCGYLVNHKIIYKLANISGVKVQVGGGIRTKDAICDYLKGGISYVILGTKAFLDKKFLKEVVELYQNKIILSLDIKNSRLALSGWYKTTSLDIKKLKKELSSIKQIIYTDVSRDGTLKGPNLRSISRVASHFKSNIIVSGGIGSIKDIEEILKLKKQSYNNISGVILGKALYRGTIDLSTAIEGIHGRGIS